MADKWYSDPNCDWIYESKKEEQANIKKLRDVCKALVATSLISAVGLVGSVELGNVSLSQFLVYELIAVIVLVVSTRILCKTEI